jgi:hypothetical protein
MSNNSETNDYNIMSASDFGNYLDDVFNKTYENISKYYNIYNLYGIISTSNLNLNEYLKILNEKKEAFNNYAHEDKIGFVEMILMFTKHNINNCIRLFKATQFPVLDLLFKSDPKHDFVISDNIITYVTFIKVNIDEIDKVYNIKEYVSNNSYIVSTKVVSLLDDCYGKFNMYPISSAIRIIAEKAYSINLWEHIIAHYIHHSEIKTLKQVFKENRWVFANIKIHNIINEIEDSLNENIETYRYSNQIEFKDFCYNNLEIIELFFKVCDINPHIIPEFMSFIQNNINKIVVIHNNISLLDKIKDIEPAWFVELDKSGFHPFIDVIRYGDFKTNKWFFDNILVNVHILADAYKNCFVDNLGMSFLLENSDFRVMELVFNYFEKYPSLLNIDDVLYISNSNGYKSIPSFSKKVKIIIKFITKNNKYYLLNNYNFLKDSLIFLESTIDNQNFTPFIIPTLYSLNKSMDQNIISLDGCLSHLQIHHKYLNKVDICKIIELSQLNTDICSVKKRKHIICEFIKLNMFTQKTKHNFICFCRFKNLVIEIVDFTFSTKFSKNINTNDGLFDALKYISFTIFNQNQIDIYDRNTFQKLNKCLIESLKHKCLCLNDDLFKSLIDLTKCITDHNESRLPFRSLGLMQNINYTEETFELIKLLSMNNYHVSWFYKLYISEQRYYTYSIYKDSKKYIFKDYSFNNKIIDEQLKINRKDNKLLVNQISKYTCFKFIISNVISDLKKIGKSNQIISLGDKIKIINPIDRSVIDKCSSFKYIDKQAFKEYNYFLNIIGFHEKSIRIPTNINKYKTFIKQIVKHLTQFKKNIDNFIKQNQIELKINKYVHAVFRIKLFVKTIVCNNFKEHKKHFDNVCLEINSTNIKKVRESLDDTSDLNEDIVSQLKLLLNDPIVQSSNVTPNDNHNHNNNHTHNHNHSYNHSLTKPSLITFSDLLYNYKSHCVITQKIDGITYRDTRLSNCYPIIKNNHLCDIEYDAENNMNFIIGLSKSRVYADKTFTTFINELRNHHLYTKGLYIPEKVTLNDLKNDNFKEILNQELNNYNKYIRDSKIRKFNGKTLWWPKMFYNLEYKSFNELIEILYFFETNPFLKVFKNDGWILQHKNYKQNEDTNKETMKAFKIKPTELITIDLIYKKEADYNRWLFRKNNNYFDFEHEFNIPVCLPNNLTNLTNSRVYRCYPIVEDYLSVYDSCSNINKIIKLEPRDIRYDRKLPNNENIVLDCLSQINNPLNFKNILSMLSNTPYYTKQPNSNRAQKYSSYTNIKLGEYISGDLIDLGAGFKTISYLQKFNEQINRCVSTDCDLNIVIKNILDKNEINPETNCFNKKIEYNYLDFTRNKNEYSGIESELYMKNTMDRFDTITLFNCINFALKSEISKKEFFKNINNLSHQETHIIIKFMDFDSFILGYNKLKKEEKNNIILRSLYDSSFININLLNMTNRIYYEWSHTNPVEEIVIGKNELIELFASNGWQFIYYKNHDKFNNSIKNLNSLWEHYFYSFSDIVFKYVRH